MSRGQIIWDRVQAYVGSINTVVMYCVALAADVAHKCMRALKRSLERFGPQAKIISEQIGLNAGGSPLMSAIRSIELD